MKYYHETQTVRGLCRINGGMFGDSHSRTGSPDGILKFVFILAENKDDYFELIKMADIFRMKIKTINFRGWDKAHYGLKMVAPSNHMAKVVEEKSSLSYDTGEEA